MPSIDLARGACLRLLTAASFLISSAPRVPAHIAPSGAPQRSALVPAPRPDRLAELRVQLASSEPAQVASGAYRAREQAAKELVPELLAALRRFTPYNHPAHDTLYVQRSLLDALLGLKADIPFKELKPWWYCDTHRRLMFCFAARQPAAHLAPLRDVLASDMIRDRCLVLRLLDEHDPAAIVARYFPHTTFQLHVRVTDAWTIERETRPSPGDRRLNAGPRPASVSFPPMAQYDISSEDTTSEFRFGGQPDLRVVRREVTADKLDFRGLGDPGFTDQDALELLCRMAALPQRIELARSIEIPWIGPGHYASDIRDAHAARVEEWEALRNALIARGWREQVEARRPDAVQVSVFDARGRPNFRRQSEWIPKLEDVLPAARPRR